MAAESSAEGWGGIVCHGSSVNDGCIPVRDNRNNALWPGCCMLAKTSPSCLISPCILLSVPSFLTLQRSWIAESLNLESFAHPCWKAPVWSVFSWSQYWGTNQGSFSLVLMKTVAGCFKLLREKHRRRQRKGSVLEMGAGAKEITADVAVAAVLSWLDDIFASP